ncbi:hypothetical protein B0H10DRAFT_2329931 [Mycena sp. CBHHK59/15]|nr:hypothetical protein B0H10DRAFT_2329931 [Mycena sp. CBHHK59/15]
MRGHLRLLRGLCPLTRGLPEHLPHTVDQQARALHCTQALRIHGGQRAIWRWRRVEVYTEHDECEWDRAVARARECPLDGLHVRLERVLQRAHRVRRAHVGGACWRVEGCRWRWEGRRTCCGSGGTSGPCAGSGAISLSLSESELSGLGTTNVEVTVETGAESMSARFIRDWLGGLGNELGGVASRGRHGERRVAWRAEGGVDSVGEARVWHGQQRQHGRGAGVAWAAEEARPGCGEWKAAWRAEGSVGSGGRGQHRQSTGVARRGRRGERAKRGRCKRRRHGHRGRGAGARCRRGMSSRGSAVRGGCGERRAAWAAEDEGSAGEARVWRVWRAEGGVASGRSTGVANGGRPGQRGRGAGAAWAAGAQGGCGAAWAAEEARAWGGCGERKAAWRAEGSVASRGRRGQRAGGCGEQRTAWAAQAKRGCGECGERRSHPEGCHLGVHSAMRTSPSAEGGCACASAVHSAQVAGVCRGSGRRVGTGEVRAQRGRAEGGVGERRAAWTAKEAGGGCGEQRTTCEQTALGGGLCRGWGSETGLSQSTGMEVSTSAPWADLQLNHPAPLPTRLNPPTMQNGAADPPHRSGTMLSTERWGLGHGECCGKSSEMTNAEIAEVAAPQCQHTVVAKIRRRRLYPGPDAARKLHH